MQVSDEMADRFIYGIDEEFQRNISSYVEQTISEVMKTRPRSFNKSNISAIKGSVKASFDNLISELRKKERQNILDILNFMSKKELSDMAHALVELTSKKRRFSTDQETVGGPIDVAIVTRLRTH